MLSRKHYRDLAVITGGVAATSAAAGEQLHDALADWLEADNPRFDRERFSAAVNAAATDIAQAGDDREED